MIKFIVLVNFYLNRANYYKYVKHGWIKTLIQKVSLTYNC